MMENYEELSKQIKVLVEKGNVDEAIKMLLEKRTPGFDKQVRGLSGRLQRLKKAQRIGTIDDAPARTELNKIAEALHDLADEIEGHPKRIMPSGSSKTTIGTKNAINSSNEKSFNKWWVVASVVVLLGLAFVIYLMSQKIDLTVESENSSAFTVPATYSMKIGKLKEDIYKAYEEENSRKLGYGLENMKIEINNQVYANNDQTIKDAGIKDNDIVVITPKEITLKVKHKDEEFDIPATYSMTIGELKEKIYDTYDVDIPQEMTKLVIDESDVEEPLTLKDEDVEENSIVSIQLDKDKFKVGAKFHGGTIYKINDGGESGMLFYEIKENIIWTDANSRCGALRHDGRTGWSLADINQIIYLNEKGFIKYNIGKPKIDYWSSTSRGHGHYQSLMWVKANDARPGTIKSLKKRAIAVRSFLINE